MARLLPKDKYESDAVERGLDAGTSMSRIKKRIVSVTTPSVANREFTVAHGCSYTPRKFIQVSANKAGTISKSNTRRAFDSKYAYLQCNATTMKAELWFF